MDKFIVKLNRFWIQCIVFIFLFALLAFGSMAYILTPSAIELNTDEKIDRIDQTVERIERLVEER